MTKQKSITLDVPNTTPVEETEKHPLTIKWCEGHWARLIYALKDRGLEDAIASTDEELNERLVNGQGDPCWDAASFVNVGAFEIFGAEKIVKEYGGCPACAFANIVEHAADVITTKHGVTH